MQDQSSSESAALSQALSLAPSTKSTPAASAIKRVICPRTGKAIPKALHEARAKQTRERNTPNQQRCRAKKRAKEAAEIAEAIDGLDLPTPMPLTPGERLAEARVLRGWLESDGPMHRQYRRDERKYLAARLVALELRRELGMTPAPAMFAPRIAKALGEPVSRDRAASILKALARLEGAGGPWPDVVTQGA